MLTDLSHGKGSLVTKIVLGMVFALMLASLILMDVQGMSGARLSNGTVAEVNGERITSVDLQREMQRVAWRMNLPQSQAQSAQFAEEVLRIMIAERLNLAGLKDLHLRFSDAQVANEVKSLMSAPGAGGKDMDVKTRYETMLRNNGLSEKEFLQNIRNSLAQRVMDEALDAGKLPDPLWARVEEGRKSERRDILFVNVPVNTNAVKLDKDADAWMQQFYNDNKDKFMVPEIRKGRAFVVSKEALAEKGGEDQHDYLMEIEDAFAGGDDAVAVAKQYGLKDDAVTDKLWASEQAQGLDAGEVSSAIALEDGAYAFVVVDDVTPAQPKAFADVKAELGKLYQQKTAYEEAQKRVITLKAAVNPEAMLKGMNGVDTFARESVAYSDDADIAPLFATAQTGTLLELPPAANGDLRFAIVRSITSGKSGPYTPAKAGMDDFRAAQTDDSTILADQILTAWYNKAKIKINEKALAATVAALQPASTDESGS